MSDPICVLYVCRCGHLQAEHDGEGDACREIIEINDLGAELCACSQFAPPAPAPLTTEDAS